MKNLKALVLNSKTLKFEEAVIDNENGIVKNELSREVVVSVNRIVRPALLLDYKG